MRKASTRGLAFAGVAIILPALAVAAGGEGLAGAVAGTGFDAIALGLIALGGVLMLLGHRRVRARRRTRSGT